MFLINVEYVCLCVGGHFFPHVFDFRDLDFEVLFQIEL